MQREIQKLLSSESGLDVTITPCPLHPMYRVYACRRPGEGYLILDVWEDALKAPGRPRRIAALLRRLWRWAPGQRRKIRPGHQGLGFSLHEQREVWRWLPKQGSHGYELVPEPRGLTAPTRPR